MVAVASAARMSTGASTFASDNVRHLSRMELPGGGQIVAHNGFTLYPHAASKAGIAQHIERRGRREVAAHKHLPEVGGEGDEFALPTVTY